MKTLIAISILLLTACTLYTHNDSAPCAVSQNQSGYTITCPNGTTATITNGVDGDVGATGPQGTQGSTGATGNTGPAGSPGTSITAIPFCSNNSSYPYTFSEIGFCIDNELYAVYSANDGFLTLVPPGTYYSNGINASCTFTVLADCVVEN